LTCIVRVLQLEISESLTCESESYTLLSRRYKMRKFLVLAIVAVVVALTASTVYAAPPPDGPPGLEKAIAAQEAHNPQLLATPGVVGTAVGLDESNLPAIIVFTERAGVGTLPTSLDGVPVLVRATGKFSALAPPPGKGPPEGKGPKEPKEPKTTDKWPLPVPIGVSTGNENECSAGTIGARVVDSDGNVFALSNNHVYTLENAAGYGDNILQPGLYDTKCRFRGNNIIGSFYAYEPLLFGSGTNYIDAAIASSSTDYLSNATPPDGYGVPSSTIESDPAPGSTLVQKYGRTTRLTTGVVYAISYDGDIGYGDSGTAFFEDQIVVLSITSPFCKPGDSGSLIVTVEGLNPVGLLFAGNKNGTVTIANPIGPVLGRFHVDIDGSE
jgi:hypothetical protein